MNQRNWKNIFEFLNWMFSFFQGSVSQHTYKCLSCSTGTIAHLHKLYNWGELKALWPKHRPCRINSNGTQLRWKHHPQLLPLGSRHDETDTQNTRRTHKYSYCMDLLLLSPGGQALSEAHPAIHNNLKVVKLTCSQQKYVLNGCVSTVDQYCISDHLKIAQHQQGLFSSVS